MRGPEEIGRPRFLKIVSSVRLAKVYFSLDDDWLPWFSVFLKVSSMTCYAPPGGEFFQGCPYGSWALHRLYSFVGRPFLSCLCYFLFAETRIVSCYHVSSVWKMFDWISREALVLLGTRLAQKSKIIFVFQIGEIKNSISFVFILYPRSMAVSVNWTFIAREMAPLYSIFYFYVLRDIVSSW